MAPLLQGLLRLVSVVVVAHGAAATAAVNAPPPAAAAADPPKPQLPGAYSVVWDLTEGTAGSMVVVATGTTDVDDAGQGKQRDVLTIKRKSDLHPGLNFHSVIDTISDYTTGDKWTHSCSNQTITEVCTCERSALSGSIPYIDPADWSYAGVAIIDGKVLTRWHVTPTIIWTVTSGAKPNLLIDALESEGVDLTEQVFRDYVLKSPVPSRWVIPKAWVSRTLPSLPLSTLVAPSVSVLTLHTGIAAELLEGLDCEGV